LHTHSKYSDGSFTPKEVVRMAKEAGLSAIALTDHDTHAGIKEAKEEAEKLGIHFIPGVELSTKFKEGSFAKTDIHILCLNFDLQNEKFNKNLEKIREDRHNINLKIIEAFKAEGIELKYEEILEKAGVGVVMKVHFVEVLIDKGYASSHEEAFKRFFSGPIPTNIVSRVLEPRECIEIIKNSGGLSFLAHPFRYKMDTGALIDELTSLGIDGVEVIYPTHSEEDTEFLMQKAKENNLMMTGGSDFHGASRERITLGCVNVPYSFIEDYFL